MALMESSLMETPFSRSAVTEYGVEGRPIFEAGVEEKGEGAGLVGAEELKNELLTEDGALVVPALLANLLNISIAGKK